MHKDILLGILMDNIQFKLLKFAYSIWIRLKIKNIDEMANNQ